MKTAAHLFYTCTLEGGSKSTGQYRNAVDAIHDALTRFPGRRVVECFSGHKEVFISSGGLRMAPAWIDYEVPKHEPFIPAPAQKKKEKPKDESFFPLEELEAESKKAKNNYERATVFLKS